MLVPVAGNIEKIESKLWRRAYLCNNCPINITNIYFEKWKSTRGNERQLPYLEQVGVGCETEKQCNARYMFYL